MRGRGPKFKGGNAPAGRGLVPLELSISVNFSVSELWKSMVRG